jgi:outer membrane receptor protein involved in Fe transport
MIKSVEVITSPSSKYDAEGSSGIINIITKKNTLEGFSLNIDGGVGLRGSNLGLNGNYRKGKMGFSLGGFGRSNYNARGSFTNNQQTIDANGNQIRNIQSADTRNNNLFGRYQLGWDYDIDKNNFISSSVQFGVRNGRNYQDNLLTQSYENQIQNELRTRLQDVESKDLSNTVDVNLNYTHMFAKPQREFSILTQYSRNNRNNDFVRNSFDLYDFSVLNRTKNLNDSYNQETTIQLDYQTPINKNQMLEVGGKGIRRQVSSDYVYLFAQGSDGEFAPSADGQLANVFNYNQNITAGYFAYTLTTKKSYSLKAGARYEYTTIDANFQDEQEVKIPSYGTLVPSVNLSKKLKNGNTIKVAYNRRIQRPSLQFLNPNIQSSNPLYITIGNPDLRPEFTDNYELAYNTYIKKTSLSFSAFMRNTTGAIQSIRDILGDTIRTSYRNIGNEDAYGLSVFANVNISNRLSLNGGTDVYYAMLDNNVSDPLFNASNEGWVYNIRGFGSYKLTKDWGLQLFGFYRGREVQLQGLQGGFGIYSLGLKKDFNNKKGSLGFGAENFFGTSIKVRNELNSPVLTQTSINERRNLSFRVNFSYRIGKLKMDDTSSRRRRKSVANDDLKDGGGSNAQEGVQPQGGQGEGQRQGAPQGQKPAQTPAQGQSPANNKGTK